MSLTGDEILSAEDRAELVKVDVPEWGPGAFVFLGIMSGEERDAYDSSQVIEVNGKYKFVAQNPRANLLVRSMSNEKGERLFRPDQVRQLAGKNSIVLDRLYAEAAKLNGISAEGQEDIEKN